MKETIIAVGNGGYNLAADLIAAGLFPDARLIVCDTSEMDLGKNSANADESIHLAKLSKKVRSTDTELVEEVVAKTTDTVIVCATLGGMAGSKYAPLIALGAILKGKFVCSFFSMPYAFEGEQMINRAMDARLQLIVSSNFAVQQNNDRLKEVESLWLNEMNKPLVETVKATLSERTLESVATECNNEALQSYIPEEYRVKDLPLVWLRSDTYRGISEDERKSIFDQY